MSIRLLIADDDAVVRLGLEQFFADADIRVVALAGSVVELVRLAAEHRPQVVLLEARMTEGDILGALEEIHSSSRETRAVVFSAYDNPTYVARAIAQGAVDFLPKNSSRDDVVAAVATAAEKPTSRSARMEPVAARMLDSSTHAVTDSGLTGRECQVVRHLAYGLSNREIAHSLEISVETVKEHVQNVLRKLKAADRTQAAVWALRKKLV